MKIIISYFLVLTGIFISCIYQGKGELIVLEYFCNDDMRNLLFMFITVREIYFS